MKKAPPTVSIVIPAFNEAEMIEKCVMSCLDQSVMPKEVIVVDNKSTDDTAKIVRRIRKDHPQVRLVKEHDEQGIIPARNAGLNAARSAVIGRIDADSTVSHGWVEATQKTFADEEVAAATGPVTYHDMPAQEFSLKADTKIRAALSKLAKSHHHFLFGSNMAVRRSVWREMAGEMCLDKDDLFHEDIDIAIHLHEAGHKIVYAPEMIGSMSARRLDDSPRKFYHYVMRYERTFKSHDVKAVNARIPIFIYLLLYFPVRSIRKFYDGDTNKFTLSKLSEELKTDRPLDS